MREMVASNPRSRVYCRDAGFRKPSDYCGEACGGLRAGLCRSRSAGRSHYYSAARTGFDSVLLAIHLAGRRADVLAADGGRLIRTLQQDVALVHHRVVDELPLVVGLLLVVNANRWIFAQAGDADDRPASKRLAVA